MKSMANGTPIRINNVRVDLDENLPDRVEQTILDVAGTYFGRLNHGVVGFTREGHTYSCTINLYADNLRVVIGEADADDCHQAFDRALGRVRNQLNRRKERMSANRGEQ